MVDSSVLSECLGDQNGRILHALFSSTVIFMLQGCEQEGPPTKAAPLLLDVNAESSHKVSLVVQY